MGIFFKIIRDFFESLFYLSIFLIRIGLKLARLIFLLKFLKFCSVSKLRFLSTISTAALTALPTLFFAIPDLFSLSLLIFSSTILSFACIILVFSVIYPPALLFVWSTFSILASTYTTLILMLESVISKIVSTKNIFTFSGNNIFERIKLMLAFSYVLCMLTMFFLNPEVILEIVLFFWVYPAIVEIGCILFDIAKPIFEPIIYAINKYMLNPFAQYMQYLFIKICVATHVPIKKGSSYYYVCKNLLSSSLFNGDIKEVKFLLTTGINLKIDQYDLRRSIRNGKIELINILLDHNPPSWDIVDLEMLLLIDLSIYKTHPKIAFRLLDLIPKNVLDGLIPAYTKGIFNENSLFHQYRVHKTKENIIAIVHSSLANMLRVDAASTEPELILHQILPMLKPEWYAEHQYRTVCQNVYKRTLDVMNKKTEKKDNKKITNDLPCASIPKIVSFKENSDKTKQKMSEAKNEVLYQEKIKCVK
jgi:hypothetical protein